MTTLSGSVAVDVVLRERDAIAALSNVVRAIRRFAEAPLLNRLYYAVTSFATGAELDAITIEHNEDLRLDALEGHPSQQKPLSEAQRVLVGKLVMYAAEHNSARVIEWALSTSVLFHVEWAVRIAISYNRLAVVQLLYPRMSKWLSSSQEVSLFNDAAASAYYYREVLQWMFANRIHESAMCNETASEYAARRGHLDVLKWIHSVSDNNQLFNRVLEQATLHGQQDVMDWICEQRVDCAVWLAMQSMAKKRDYTMLMWLHDKFPAARISLVNLEEMVFFGLHLDVVDWLVRHYPDRYAADRVAMGRFCGDLEVVKRLAARQSPTRKEVKNAMTTAAKHGHLAVLQWLSHYFGDYHVPNRVLWRALCRGNLNVVRWIMEQTPELITKERLARMHTTCVRQPKKNMDSRGDIEELTRWIEAQQWSLIERESQI